RALLFGHARRRATARFLAPAARCLVAARGLRARDRQFHRVGAMGRVADGLDLRSRAYGGRPLRAGQDEVTRRVDAAWLREAPLRDILAALDGDGEEARIVGGAVRNALLGEPHGDIDIATTAPPGEVIRGVEAAGFKAVPTGVEHGTVTVVAAGQPFEVTTLREDVETFGRHAKVVFGRDWKRDAGRRGAPVFHNQRLVAVPGGDCPRLCRWLGRYRGAARALHRRRGQAHRRRLSAYPALLPLPRRLWRGHPGSGRARRLHRRTRRPRATLARARAHGDGQ